ncbi:NADH:flavin oxidoreductase, Old Yellow Enzyme family protein [Operophtera brumata]|uniref:NADH:flavin oxidoreductase, Old Yellow Enzyme family protein n=1 Tax=Operophtera brumata TaxID=104452 RepID=A0A0L7LS94_OPEBR|nr:NADH:flavin oxidoreductase, Old Yellow Enzyme family protein [Operophtera brumata]
MAGNDNEIADAMSDAAEGGASIAWRLLATLEGGSLLLAATALLAYTASSGIARRTQRRPCKSVLITSTTSKLGGELKRRLELYGCTVSTVTSGATREASSGSSDDVDALVVIGAKPKGSGLNGISDLVTEDVYDNLKLLESLSSRVSRGGRIAWACAGAEEGEGASAVADKGEGASAGADMLLLNWGSISTDD